MAQIVENIVKPKDCLLVIGIPLTIDDFLKDIKENNYKDFAKSVQRGFKLNETQLIEKYKNFIILFNKNIEEIRDLGGNVITDFSLSELNKIPNYKVFTLVSHWRSSRILISDIKNSEKIKDIIIENPLIFNELSNHLKTTNSFSLSELLIFELNNLLKDKNLYKNVYSPYNDNEFQYPDIYTEYLNRNFLDMVFQGNIGKGNCIELFDKIHSIDSFVKSIPNNFTNLFDLSICNSIMLQDEIKRQHNNCTVFASKDTVRLDYKIIFYKGIIKKLKQKEMSYINAYFELIKDLKS
jgi:hypothetical protein